jgi:hypothetical protein
MAKNGIELQRISLGALIIALGMLVDNAIVVTEGVLIGMKRGLSKLEAANAIVGQTMWPLLGATVIAILAFAPIGLSPDSTGEFAGSLFWVLLYSLFLSWFTAITLTPFFCDLLFKEEIKEAAESGGAEDDPYKGMLYVVYRKLLDLCMRQRIVTVVLLIAMLAGAIVGFGKVQQSFFPPSTTPIFMVDFWLPEVFCRLRSITVPGARPWRRPDHDGGSGRLPRGVLPACRGQVQAPRNRAFAGRQDRSALHRPGPRGPSAAVRAGQGHFPGRPGHHRHSRRLARAQQDVAPAIERSQRPAPGYHQERPGQFAADEF